MTRSKPASAHAATFPVILIAATAAVATVAATAAVQPDDQSAMWSWVDRYYADYTAMSAAPTGPAMDKWLAHYAAFAFFEDPTLGQSGIGADQIRKPYLEAFTGPWGPVRWTILRRATSGEWAAVEGWLDGTQSGKAVRTRFTTWLKIRNGKIVHQIDYLDYGSMKRQVAGTETVSPNGSRAPAPVPQGRRNPNRALRIADEFYQRYDAMPVLASPTGLTRFIELMTDDFRLEDPTAQLLYDSREKMQAQLKTALATTDWGPIHWDLDRKVTDGEWVAAEGFFRGIYKQRPFATRFTMWLQTRGDKVARQIDYIDYATFRRMTSLSAAP